MIVPMLTDVLEIMKNMGTRKLQFMFLSPRPNARPLPGAMNCRTKLVVNVFSIILSRNRNVRFSLSSSLMVPAI